MAVVIETTLGDITVDLYTKERPKTCLNFLKLCKMKYYNFNLFHSVQHNFIAQTGDPTGSGHGGESVFGHLYGEQARYYAGEQMPKIKHSRAGLVSMVNCGDNMLGAQFFITLGSELSSLDGEHCIFGEVTEGEDVLLKLNEAICDESHRPYQDIRITHTVVLEDPFDDPPNLKVPDRSPSPTKERLMNGRIAPDEAIDEMQGKTMEEVEELVQEKEAAARATILEIVGDLPDADMAPPENVLFVCKLNPVTNDDDLEIIFSRFGKINSCEVIRDKVSGDSLQYAFIEFAEQKSCEEAYFKMDNVLIDDRRIHVDFSQSVSKVRWKGKGRGVEHLGSKPGEKVESERHRNNKNSGYDRGPVKQHRVEHSPPRKKRADDKRDSFREREENRRREERERRHMREYANRNNTRERSRDRSRSSNKVANSRDRNKDRSRSRNRDRNRDRSSSRSQQRGKSKSPPRKNRDRSRSENGEHSKKKEVAPHKDEKKEDKVRDGSREKTNNRSKERQSSKNDTRSQEHQQKVEPPSLTEIKKDYKKGSSATSTPQLNSRESSPEKIKSKSELNGKKLEKNRERSSSVKSKEEKQKSRSKKRSRSSSNEKEVKVIKQKHRKVSSSSESSSESSSSTASSEKPKHREKKKKKKKVIVVKKKSRTSKHKKKKVETSSEESTSESSDSDSEPPKSKHKKNKKKSQAGKSSEKKTSHKKKRRASVTSTSQSSSSSESESSESEVPVKKKKSKKVVHKSKNVGRKKKEVSSKSRKRKVETESSESSSEEESYSKKRKVSKKSSKKRQSSESESSSD